jgi:hypothetical protein
LLKKTGNAQGWRADDDLKTTTKKRPVSLTAKQELDRIGKALALGLRAGGACSVFPSQTKS